MYSLLLLSRPGTAGYSRIPPGRLVSGVETLLSLFFFFYVNWIKMDESYLKSVFPFFLFGFIHSLCLGRGKESLVVRRQIFIGMLVFMKKKSLGIAA